MSDLREFSELVGDLYDAALETSLFPSVMEKIKTYLDGAVTALLCEDVLNNQSTLVFGSKMDEDWVARYFAEYMHINPVRGPSLPFVKTGDAFSTLTFLTDEEFRGSRYYQEWFRPKGYLDTMQMVLERSSMTFNLLSCARYEHQGYATRHDLERMALLAPHVRRAVGICRLIEMKTFEADKFVVLVDRLAAAVVFTNHDRRIVHANAAAERMLDAGVLIRRQAGCLTTCDPAATASLTTAIKSAVQNPRQKANGAAIILAQDPRRYVAHVLPLETGRCALAGQTYGAAAAIFIRDVGVDPTSAATSLVQLYDLTKRELSVLLCIVAEHRASETAAILGLSQETVKTHMKNIFKKVGVHRQSELATLVAGIANPFVADHASVK